MAKQVELEWLNDDDTNDSAQVGGQQPSRSFMDTIGDAINAIGANFDVVRGSNRIGDLMESLAEPDRGTTEEQYYQNLDKLQKEYAARELAQRKYQDAQDRLVAEDSFLKNITQMGGTLEGMAAQAIGTAGGAALGSLGGFAGASTGAKIGNALGAAAGGYLDARSVALEAREKVLEEGGTWEQAQEAYEEALKKASLTTIPETAVDIILGNRLLGSVSGRIGSSALLDPAAKIGTGVSRAFNPLAGHLAGFATDVALQGSTEALQEVTQDYIADREIAKALNRPDNEYSFGGFGQYAMTPQGLETMKTAGIMGALFGGIGGAISSGKYLQHGAKTREGNMTYHAVKNMEKNGDLYINPDNREAEIQTLAEMLERDGVDESTIRGWSNAELAAASAEVRGKHVARISPLEAQDKSIVRQAADFGNRVLSTDEHRNLKESDLTPESRELLKQMGIEDGMVEDMFSPKRGKNILDTTKKEEKTESSGEAKPVVKLTQPTIESMEQGQQQSGTERKTDGVVDDFTLEFGSENDIGENWEKISQGDVQYEDTAIYRNRDNGRIVSVQKTRDGKIQVVDHGFNTDQDKLFNINNFESLPKQQYSSAKEAKQKLLDNDDNKADFRWQGKTNEQKQQQENPIDNTKNIANDIASLAKLHKAGIINDGAFLEFSALLQRAGMTKNEHNIDFQFLPDEISEDGYAQRAIDKSVGRAIVRLYYGADIGSVVHELGHNAYWNLPQEQRDLFNYYAVKSCGNFVANICGENYTQDFVNRLKSGDKKLWEKVRKSSAIKQTRFLLKSTDVVTKGIMSQEEYNFLRQQAIEERYAHELSAWYTEGYTRGIEPQNIKDRIMQRGCISVANELGVLQKVYDYVHHKGGDYGDTPIEEMYKNAYGGFTGATYSTLADQSNLYLGEQLDPLDIEEVKKAPEPKPTENKDSRPKTEYTEEEKAQNEEDKKIQNRKTIDVKGRYKEQQKEKVSDVIGQFDQKSQNEVDKLIDIIKNKKSGWQKAIQKLSNYSPSLYMDRLNGIQNSSDQPSLFAFTKTYNNPVVEEKKESTPQPANKKSEKNNNNKQQTQAKPSSETQAKQNELFNQAEQKDPNLGKDGMAVYNKLKDKEKLSKKDKAEIKGIIDRIDALGKQHRYYPLRKLLDNLSKGIKEEPSQEQQQQKSNIEKAITEKPKTLGDSPAARAVKLIKKINDKNVMDMNEADYFVNELLGAVADLKNWDKEFDGKQDLMGQLKDIVDKIKNGDFFNEEIEEESSVQDDTTNGNNEQQAVQTPAPAVETAQPVQEVAQQPQENATQIGEQRLAKLEEELKKLSTTRQIKSRLNKYLNNKDISKEEYDALSNKLLPKEESKPKTESKTETTKKTAGIREYIAYAKDKDGNLQKITEEHKNKKEFEASLKERGYAPQFVAKGEEQYNEYLNKYNEAVEKARQEEQRRLEADKKKAEEAAAKKEEADKLKEETEARKRAVEGQTARKRAIEQSFAEKKNQEIQEGLKIIEENKKREAEAKNNKPESKPKPKEKVKTEPLEMNEDTLVENIITKPENGRYLKLEDGKLNYYELVENPERGINPATGKPYTKPEAKGYISQEMFDALLDAWDKLPSEIRFNRETFFRSDRGAFNNLASNTKTQAQQRVYSVCGWSEKREKIAEEKLEKVYDRDAKNKKPATVKKPAETKEEGQKKDAKKPATTKKPAKPKTETDPFKALHKKFKNVTGGEIGKTTVYKADEKAFIKAWMGRVDDAITSKKETLNDIIKSLEEWKQNNIDQKRTDVIYDYIQNYVIEAGKQFPDAVQNKDNKDTRSQMNTQKRKEYEKELHEKAVKNKEILDKAFPNTRFQIASHSGKVDFSEFSLAYLSTGVGDQVHGHGVYVSISPVAAKGYFDLDKEEMNLKEKLASKKPSKIMINGVDKTEQVRKLIYTYERNLGKIENENRLRMMLFSASANAEAEYENLRKQKEDIDFVFKTLNERGLDTYQNRAKSQSLQKQMDLIEKDADRMEKMIYEIEKGIIKVEYNIKYKNSPTFYEVNMPEIKYMIEETAPFDKQSKQIKQGIIKTVKQIYKTDNDGALKILRELPLMNEVGRQQSGRLRNPFVRQNHHPQIYWDLVNQVVREYGKKRKEAKKYVSELLNKNGVQGIHYYGQRDGECAVIFNDKALDILNKFQRVENKWEKLDKVGNERNRQADLEKAQRKLEKHRAKQSDDIKINKIANDVRHMLISAKKDGYKTSDLEKSFRMGMRELGIPKHIIEKYQRPIDMILDTSKSNQAMRFVEALYEFNKKMWETSNIYRGLDGEWRVWIDDNEAEFKTDMLDSLVDSIDVDFYNLNIEKGLTLDDFGFGDTAYKLGEVLKHDKLFAYYPELKKMKLYFKTPHWDSGLNENTGGYFDTLNNEIVINLNALKEFNSSKDNKKEINNFLMNILLHEIQHSIQHKEGFASRFNPESFGMVIYDQKKADRVSRLIKRFKNDIIEEGHKKALFVYGEELSLSGYETDSETGEVYFEKYNINGRELSDEENIIYDAYNHLYELNNMSFSDFLRDSNYIFKAIIRRKQKEIDDMKNDISNKEYVERQQEVLQKYKRAATSGIRKIANGFTNENIGYKYKNEEFNKFFKEKDFDDEENIKKIITNRNKDTDSFMKYMTLCSVIKDTRLPLSFYFHSLGESEARFTGENYRQDRVKYYIGDEELTKEEISGFRYYNNEIEDTSEISLESEEEFIRTAKECLKFNDMMTKNLQKIIQTGYDEEIGQELEEEQIDACIDTVDYLEQEANDLKKLLDKVEKGEKIKKKELPPVPMSNEKYYQRLSSFDGGYIYIQKDNNTRSQLHSEKGMPKADINSPAFKEWFKGSILKNKDGSPMVLYRGMRQHYDPTFNKEEGNAVWLSVDKAVAESYRDTYEVQDTYKGKPYNYVMGGKTGLNEETGDLAEVYANIQKPFDFGEIQVNKTNHDIYVAIGKQLKKDVENGKITDEQMQQVLRDLEYLNKKNKSGNYPATNDRVWKQFKNKKLFNAFKSVGYDSIKAIEDGDLTYGVFDKGNIKSIYNKGTFNRNDKDIRNMAIGELGKNSPLANKEFKNKLEQAWEKSYRKWGSRLNYSNEEIEESLSKYKNIEDEKVFDRDQDKLAEIYARLNDYVNRDFWRQGIGKDVEGTRARFRRELDGRWRFYIPDNKMQFKPRINNLLKLKNTGKKLTLDQVIKHDLLFKYYPDLKKIEVEICDSTYDKELKGSTSAYYDENEETIVLNAKDLSGDIREVQRTMLHEIQHIIQDEEGFAQGGSPEDFAGNQKQLTSFAKGIFKKKEEFRRHLLNKGFDEKTVQAKLDTYFFKDEKSLENIIKNTLNKNPSGKFGKEFKSWIASNNKIYNEYKNLLGEIEARETEKRFDYTDEQLETTPPMLYSDSMNSLKYDNNGKVIARGTRDKRAIKDSRSQLKSEKGMPIADTNTNAFRKWFGNSTAIKSDGSPRVFYRGQGHEYDPNYKFDKTDANRNKLTWVAQNRQFIDDGAYNGLDGEGDVWEVYIRTENPFNMGLIDSSTDEAEKTPMELYEHVINKLKREVKYRRITPKQFEETKQKLSYLRQNRRSDGKIQNYKSPIYYFLDKDTKLVGALKDLGYDSILGIEDDTNTFALFDPNQVKSIYNDGQWSHPTDIRHQKASKNLQILQSAFPDTRFQFVWHGSGYNFNEFTLEHIGEGEGAAAHGWGLYFGKDWTIGEKYANVLQRKGHGKGYIYKVEVPDDIKLLSEDGLLKNNSKEVIEKLKNVYDKYFKNSMYSGVPFSAIANKWSGKKFMMELDDVINSENKKNGIKYIKGKSASLALKEFGIDGHHYIGGLDGKCCVIWNDQAVKLLEKYDRESGKTTSYKDDTRSQKMSKKERKKEQKEYVKRETADAIEKGEITDIYKDVYSVSFDESAQNNGENQKKMKYFNDRSEFWDRHESNGTVTYTRKTPFEHHQKVIKYSGINGVQKTMKEKSKPRQWYEWAKDQAIKYLFNDKQYLAKLARHLGVYDAYTRMMVTEGYAQRANVALTEGIMYNGKRTRALNDIIKTVGYQKQKRFLDYCIAHRILNLKERDPKIEQKMSLEEAHEIIEREQNGADAKLFEDNRVDFVDYNKALLHVLVDGGIISEDTFQKFCKNDPDFVPLAKVLDGADLGFNSIIHAHSLINVKSPVKKIGTSMREVKNPFLEMQKRTAEYYSIAARNRAGQIFVNEICGKLDTMFDGDTVQRGAGIIRKVRVDEQNGKLITKPDDQKQIIYVCNNGKHEFYQVADREIYLALKSLSDDQMNTLTKMIDRVAHAPAHLIRESATIVPDFGVRNLIRDNFEAFLTSEHGFIPFFDAMWGVYQMANNTEWYQRYLDQVGEYGTLNRESQRVDNLATYSSTIDDKISYAQNLKEIYKEQMAIIKDTNKAYSDVINEKNSPQRKLLAFIKLFVSPIWAGGKSLKRFNDYMEQGTRIGEFKNAKKKYEGLLDRLGKDALKWNIGFDAIKDNSDIMAAGAAKEITLNFAQHGSLGKMINRWVPFFNATMQGVYKFGNTMDLLFKGNDMSNNKNRRLQKELAFKTALMVAFGIGVAAAGEGDEDYDEAPEWEKKNFWIFPNGMRLPKDQVLGTIVGTAAEESYRQWRKGKAEPSKLLEIICEHFSPNNITPAIIDTMFVGFMANYDSFKKQDIVPEYMKQRRGFLQKDLNTANVAVAISESLYNTLGWDVSAKKIDFAINKNLSNTAKYMNAILDLGLAKNEKMARGYDKSDSTGAFVGGLRDRVPTPLNLVTGTFATNRTSYQSINEFYDKYNKLKIASSHEQSMTEEEKRLWKRYQKAYKEDTKLRKQLREIKNNASLNKDQKREKADPIFKKQIKLAKWAEGE